MPALAAIFAAAALPARAQDVTEDWHLQVAIALQNGNCELALSLTEAARLTKDPEADFRFGVLYERGECVSQDDARALAHFVASVDAGIDIALPRIVLIYAEGRVPPDTETERVWRQRMTMSFVLMLRDARLPHLQLLLYDRDTVPDELAAEIGWLAELEDGDPSQLFETAVRISDGDGWPQDYDVAARWLERAGDGGVPEAHYEAAQLLFDPERGTGIVPRGAKLSVRGRPVTALSKRKWSLAGALRPEIRSTAGTMRPTCGC